MNSHFLAEFNRLDGLELHDFMEAKLADTHFTVEQNDLEIIYARMNTFVDEYHLVYCILLLTKFAPEKIVLELPKYLLHREISVRCAAINALNGVNLQLVSHELLSALASVKEISSSKLEVDRIIARLLRKK